MGEFVRVERDDAVATIRLDRPPANALSREVALELSDAARAVATDDTRAVVIWGGERIFAAGADIKVMADLEPDEITSHVGALEKACRDVEAIPKPVIAAINGFALGGGCEVAISCDLRFAADDARIGLPEIRLGIIPGSGGTQRLPRLIGLVAARRLILSGDNVTADEALAIALVDRVFPRTETYAAAVEAARAYAGGPTLAYAAAKRSLTASLGTDLATGLAVEREEFVRLFATRDRKEGMRAFLEKRDPSFEGR
jgi:enoyl-CoA hydratase/carnithine racemase